MDPVKTLIKAHSALYRPSGGIRVFSCPGRINLIGEHIDYNGGHVLPAAIDKKIYLAVSTNDDKKFRFNDLQFEDRMELSFDAFRGRDARIGKAWLYPYGALKLMLENPAGGYDLSYFSTIPAGAGVSSSAAITTVTLYALAVLTRTEIDDAGLALAGQRVEKEFAGVSCGIMDQFAVIHGKKDNAMLLDTRDLSFEYVAVDSNRIHFILINSGIKHSLRESGYNDRRRECEAALEILKSGGLDIRHLCDLDSSEFIARAGSLGVTEYKRALHAVSENERTMEFHRRLKENDYPGAGKLLFESHESLRDNFQVSITELDDMVRWAREIPGVYGARMMGGGFGGCTINMVELSFIGEFTARIARRFKAAFGKKPDIYDCTIEDGVKELAPE